MMPPMNQKVVAKIDKIAEDGTSIKDKYGRPQTVSVESRARVQFKSQVVRDAQGVEHRVNLEIDIPPEFNPNAGASVEYTDISNRTFSGIIRAKDEVTNVPATKVYFRTVFVDG